MTLRSRPAVTLNPGRSPRQRRRAGLCQTDFPLTMTSTGRPMTSAPHSATRLAGSSHCTAPTRPSTPPASSLHTRIPPPHFTGWRVGTWNARAYTHHRPSIRRAKARPVRALLNPLDILFLQKTHGTTHALRSAARRYHAAHRAWSSASPDPSSGGVCILIAHTALREARPRHTVLVPGRAHSLRLVFRDGSAIQFVNMHNERLTTAHRRRIVATLDDPTIVTFIGSDMNFPPPGESTTHVLPDGTARQSGRTAIQRLWAPLLRRASPMPPPVHTRFATSSDDQGDHAIGPTIDCLAAERAADPHGHRNRVPTVVGQ